MTFITGDAEVDAALRALHAATYQIVRPALSKALTAIAREIRRSAPRGPTGNLKKAIGSRVGREKNSFGIVAKVGVNVGKGRSAKGSKVHAPHGHLVALGTVSRKRKSGGSTGVMPVNPFVREAVERATPAAREALLNGIRKSLAKQAARRASTR